MLYLSMDYLAAEPTGRSRSGTRGFSELGRIARGTIRLLKAGWTLRKCESVGRRVGVRGSVRVDAAGRIRVGNGVRIHAHLSKTQLMVRHRPAINERERT